MIIIELKGGLGNQMFQYAHGKALAMEEKTSLGLDTSWYKGRTDRAYLLDNFAIDAKVAGWFRTAFSKKIRGDFQSESYFKNYEDIIRKEFALKENLSGEKASLLGKISSANSVSIHLRGGDYVHGKKSDFHGTCSPQYYADAISLIRSKVALPHFFIFTDDLPWAQCHIDFPEPHTIVSGSPDKPYEDLFLMSSCKHNIIANSTFSWWGAWLNNNKDKIVTAPKKWFNDETVDTKDIVPEGWIKL